MTTSENQVRHLYVVNSASDITPTKGKDGVLYFGLKDVDGKAIRSDLITNILHAKATAAEAMQRKLKAIKITATDADMVAGQDYIVQLEYRKFISQSDEDTYQEVGMARAKKTGDDVEVVLAELAKNLYANTKKQELVEVKVIVGGVEKAVSALLDTDVVTAIVIREIEQPWKLGIKQEEAVEFSVATLPIIVSGAEAAWATITDETASSTVIGNGKKTADLEYFLMGERGDIYRNMGWPNVIPTRYLADATKVYDYIDIHYAYAGTCEDVQKSEKDITLVIPAGSVGSVDHTVASTVLAAINALNVVTIEEPDEWNAE